MNLEFGEKPKANVVCDKMKDSKKKKIFKLFFVELKNCTLVKKNIFTATENN